MSWPVRGRDKELAPSTTERIPTLWEVSNLVGMLISGHGLSFSCRSHGCTPAARSRPFELVVTRRPSVTRQGPRLAGMEDEPIQSSPITTQALYCPVIFHRAYVRELTSWRRDRVRSVNSTVRTHMGAVCLSFAAFGQGSESKSLLA